MKKSSLKKISSLLLAFVMALGTIVVSAPEVKADSDNWILSIGAEDDYVWEGTDYIENVLTVRSDEDDYYYGTITSAVTDDESVAVIKSKVGYDGSEYYTEFYLKPKKVGTTKVTVEFITRSEEVKTAEATIRVRKYPKPIKSMKISGKAVDTSKYKYHVTRKVSRASTAVRIKMALKSGWKITYVSAHRSKSGKEGSFKWYKVTKKQLLKGSALSFPKKYKYFNVALTLKKGSEEINYNIYIRRK